MESESQAGVDSHDEKAKQEHIKQRLKEMGVSDDSERPAKSWLSKYGKYLMAGIAGVLVIAYWVEYSKQDTTPDVVAAEDATGSGPVQDAGNSYAVSPNEQMTQPDYYPAPWMQPPWVARNNSDNQSVADNKNENTHDNKVNQNTGPQNNYPYYAPRYPRYPYPYWNNNQGSYPAARAPVQPPVQAYDNQQANSRYVPRYPGYYGPPPVYATPYGRAPYYYGGQRY